MVAIFFLRFDVNASTETITIVQALKLFSRKKMKTLSICLYFEKLYSIDSTECNSNAVYFIWIEILTNISFVRQWNGNQKVFSNLKKRNKVNKKKEKKEYLFWIEYENCCVIIFCLWDVGPDSILFIYIRFSSLTKAITKSISKKSRIVWTIVFVFIFSHSNRLCFQSSAFGMHLWFSVRELLSMWQDNWYFLHVSNVHMKSV